MTLETARRLTSAVGHNGAVRPIVAVLLASLCFGTTGTAVALADVDASPLAVGAARIMVGGALLALVARWWARRARVGEAVAPTRRPVPARRLAVTIALGALGVLAYQPAFFAGTRANGVALGTVIALGSAPVITGVFAAVHERRAPSPRWALATALALVGVVLVADVTGGGKVSVGGLAGSVGAGASYALYTLASKELLDAGWSAPRAMGNVFGWAAVASVPVVVFAGTAWIDSWRGLALVAWLGVVTTAVGYVLFGNGLARLPAPTVSTLTLAEPLTATVLGLTVLGEHLGATPTVGLLVLLTGLAVLALPARREAQPDPSRA